jgi:hypothetical protein
VLPASRRACALAVAALFLGACRSPWVVAPGPVEAQDCPGSAAVRDAVFLIGDAGDPQLPQGEAMELVDPVLRALHADVGEAVSALGVEHTTVVFLGDNVYPHGLEPTGGRGRRRGERVLLAQIAASAPVRAIFVAGNHDWDIEGAFLARQEPRVSMRPTGGCAGPDVVDFGPTLRFVFLDEVGWFHAAVHPEQHAAACPHGDALEVFHALAGAFAHPDGRHVVLATHHPLITSGPHGGHYTWKQHLFPLTDFWPWAWIPLPVIGSIYPLSRSLGVTRTDVTSDPYQRYLFAVYRASRPSVPMLIAAGHEHSLQVHRDAVGLYYAVSGAGSESMVTRVEAQPSEMMALAAPGYMRLDSHADGSLGLTVFALLDGHRREPVYRHCLAGGPPAAGAAAACDPEADD